MKHISVLLAGLTLSLCTALPACADVLYTQAPNMDNSNNSAWISETANGTDGAGQAFDNFTLGADGTISTVSWTGWMNPSFTDIQSFTITFYDDTFDVDNNIIGQVLSSTVVTGDANEALIGSKNAFGIFSFSADVTPFDAVKNTQYWISIVANPTLNSGTYHWANSDDGDSNFYLYDSTISPTGTDLAFTLSNPSAVPEPSSLAFAGTGMLALGGVVRRRVRRG